MLELLVVVVILGLVAAFVLPEVGETKEKAYVSAMKNDARNVANFQELYFNDHDQYASTFNDLSQAVQASLTDDVTIVSDEGDQQSFRYVLGHAQTNTRCVVKTVDSNIRQACGTDNTINANVSGATADFSLQENELAFSNTQSFELLQAAGIQPLAADIPSDAQLVWHFGDGTTISGQALTHTNVSHTYAESGNYDVEVDVEYPNGKTAFAFSRVSANVLDADFTITPNPAAAMGWLTLDGSSSTGVADDFTPQWGVIDESGQFVGFDSGEIIQDQPTDINGVEVGDNDIALVVEGPSGARDTAIKTLTVEKDIQADFTASPNPVSNTDTLTLDGSNSTGAIHTYQWVHADTWELIGETVINETSISVSPKDNDVLESPKDSDLLGVGDYIDHPVVLLVTSSNGVKDTSDVITVKVED